MKRTLVNCLDVLELTRRNKIKKNSFFSLFSSVVVDLLFYVPPIVCGGSVMVFVLECITLCPFQLCNHIEEEARASCLILYRLLYVLLLSILCGSSSRCHGLVAVFPDHTHLPFNCTQNFPLP